MDKVTHVTDEETGHTLALELHDGDCRVGLKCEDDDCEEVVVLDENCQLCVIKVIDSIQEKFRQLDIDEMQDEVIQLLQTAPLDDKVTDAGWVNLTDRDPLGYGRHHFLTDHPVEDDNEDGTEGVCDGTSLDKHFDDGDEWEELPNWLQILYEEILAKRIENGGGVVCRF